MTKIDEFQEIIRHIDKSETEAHLESCERMINNFFEKHRGKKTIQPLREKERLMGALSLKAYQLSHVKTEA